MSLSNPLIKPFLLRYTVEAFLATFVYSFGCESLLQAFWHIRPLLFDVYEGAIPLFDSAIATNPVAATSTKYVTIISGFFDVAR
jgi:hypothetical protein